MPYSVLFTFENEEDQKELLERLEVGSKSQMPAIALPKELVVQMHESVRINPDIEKEYAIHVSGIKIVEGTITDMKKRFEQEVGSHSGKVELRETCNGKTTVLRKRA